MEMVSLVVEKIFMVIGTISLVMEIISMVKEMFSLVIENYFMVMEIVSLVMEMAGLNRLFGFLIKNCRFLVILPAPGVRRGFDRMLIPSFRKQTGALLAGLVFSVRLTHPFRGSITRLNTGSQPPRHEDTKI